MADNDQSELGGTLQFKVWVTRGCYYVLSDRLKRKARYSVSAITILSFYVFVISLLTLVFEKSLPDPYPRVLSTLSIVLSVFIIIITLLEDSKGYTLDADHSWQIARDLENLFNRYEILISTDGGKDEQIRQEYAVILQNARTNRRALDYHLFQLTNAKEFGLKRGAFCRTLAILVAESIVEYWLYASMVLAPLIAIGWVAYKAFG